MRMGSVDPSSRMPSNSAPSSRAPARGWPSELTPTSCEPVSEMPFSDLPLSDLPFSETPFSDLPFRERPLGERPLRDLPLSDLPLLESSEPLRDDGADISAGGAPAPQAATVKETRKREIVERIGCLGGVRNLAKGGASAVPARNRVLAAHFPSHMATAARRGQVLHAGSALSFNRRATRTRA